MGIPVYPIFYPFEQRPPIWLHKNGINRQVAALEDKKRRQIAEAKREAASAESGSQPKNRWLKKLWEVLEDKGFFTTVRDDSWMHKICVGNMF